MIPCRRQDERDDYFEDELFFIGSGKHQDRHEVHCQPVKALGHRRQRRRHDGQKDLGGASEHGLLERVLLLQVAARTLRFAGLLQRAHSAAERPRWGGLAIFVAFALTPFVASAVSEKASEFFSPKSGDFLGFLGACAFIFAIGFLDDWKARGVKPVEWDVRNSLGSRVASGVYIILLKTRNWSAVHKINLTK